MGANIILQTGGLSAKDMLAMIVGTEPFSLTADDLAGLTDVADGAFEGCTTLTSIELPYGVTSIGARAFCGCENLESITYNGTISQWQGITKGTDWDYNTGEYTIRCTDGDIAKESLAYTFDDATQSYYVSSIGSFAGADLHIPSKYSKMPVASIGDHAFFGCNWLTSVIIPNSVISIDLGAFANCSSLTSITIPDSVTSIGGSAFIYCTGLTSATIGNSVTSIGDSAFDGCTGLTSVTIGNSVTSIGDSAFEGCSGLTTINYTGDIAGWCSISGLSNLMAYGSSTKSLYINGALVEGGLAIPNSVTTIPSAAFYKCSGLTSVTISNSVTSIEWDAFEYCSGLISVIIGNGVISIGERTFAYCTGLTSVIIPDSVTSIGNNAFYKCSGLTSVTIGISVTSIGDSAFNMCTSLTSITYNSTIAQWGAISLGTGWDQYTGNYTIHCTDGDIPKAA